MPFSSLTALLWITLTLSSHSGELKLTGYCLPPSDAAINAIRLDAPGDSVRKWLGTPTETRAGRSPGDTILIYPTMEITLGSRGRVERIVTSHRASRMPNGVRIGQEMGDALSHMKAPDNLEELEEVTWSPLLCDEHPTTVNSSLPEVTFTWAIVQEPNDQTRWWVQERRLTKIELAFRER